MELNESQQEIVVNAYLLAREGKGQVLEDWAYPDADRLAEAGWLERRFVTDDGEMSWWWAPAAETALDINALVESIEGREN